MVLYLLGFIMPDIAFRDRFGLGFLFSRQNGLKLLVIGNGRRDYIESAIIIFTLIEGWAVFHLDDGFVLQK
jgi:hypothetical protein